MGTTTTLQPIPTPEHFPMYYFDFTTFEKLSSKPDNKREKLIDFKGRIYDTTPGKTKKLKDYLRVHMCNISGTTIDLTLWEEVLPNFDRQALMNAADPVIGAFTSLKVTTFKGSTTVNKKNK